MAEGQTGWRRYVTPRRGLIGFAAGLLGGFGASIVLTQSGSLSLDFFFGLPLLSAAFAGIWAALRLPTWLDRTVGVVVILYMLGAVFLSAQPATAQEACDFDVVVSDPTRHRGREVPAGEAVAVVDLAEDPLMIWPWKDTTVTLAATAGEGASASITVNAAAPVGGWLIEGTTVWHGQLDPDDPPQVRVRVTSWLGAELDGNGVRAGVVPFGEVEVQAEIVSADGTSLCDGPVTAKFRLVTSPFTNWVGGVGMLMLALGAGGALAVGRSAPLPGRPPMPPFEPIRRADHVECRFLEQTPDGKVRHVPADEPLVVGKEYRLEVRITPGVREKEEEEEAATINTPVVASAWSQDFDFGVERVIDLEFMAGLFTVTIPLQAWKAGRLSLDVNLMAEGQLLQVERVETPVVAAGDAMSGPGQTTTTIISSSDFSDEDLTGRQPRALQVILLRDEDGSIDGQFRTTDGALVAEFDTIHQSDIVLEAARRTRAALVKTLVGTDDAAGFGAGVDATTDQLDAWLPLLAKVGRNLHDALFPVDGQVDEDQIANLRQALATDGIIQVNQDYASLSMATVPWNLVYDHLFAPGAGVTVCGSFRTHDPHHCPHATDPNVVCPTGFWGYRYRIEQPPAWVSDHLAPRLPQHLAGESRPLLHFVFEPSFGNATEHRDRVAGTTGAEVLESSTLAHVAEAWRTSAEQFDFLYFYTHSGEDPDTGAGALFLADGALTDQHLQAWKPAFDQHPLVIINGCASGAYADDTHASLLNGFRRHGSSGVVGTECIISTAIAAPLMERLLARAFAGAELGEALLEVCRSVFIESNSPVGLVYAVYGRSDAVVAPVPVPVDAGAG